MYKEKKINVFVQISMTSSRLPKKALIPIAGKNSAERVINAIKKSNYIDNVILTFTTEKVDDALEEWAIKNNKLYFRGNFKNVIKRYGDALSGFPCDYVIRVTGDCPVISVDLLDKLIEDHYFDAKSEYRRYLTHKLPIGIGGEIMTSQSIEKLLSFNLNFEYSEYMTYYFINNPHIFEIAELIPPEKYNFPKYRLTLDYIDDLHMFEKLFYNLPENSQSILDEIIKVLNKNPDIPKLNSHLSLKYKTDKSIIEILKRETVILN
jgi:spore coat polysaccharide biosynthesis protein SpsF (cytidylyltransferase family)